MDKRPLSSFQLFAILSLSSMLGVSVTPWGRFSPGYFWAVIAFFLLQSAGLALLGLSFTRTGIADTGGHLEALVTRIPARLLLLLPGIGLILRSALTLAAQAGCVSLYLLEDTPPFAVMLALLITAFISLLPGMRRLSGVSTLLVLLLPLMLALIIIAGLIGADFGELRTLVQPMPAEIAGGLIPAAVTASGAECGLLFLGHRQTGRRSLAAACAAPLLCAAVFALLSCTAVGTVGMGGMQAQNYPLVEASRQISMGGIELTERFDLPLITVSLFASIAQIAVSTLCAALSLSYALGIRRTGLTALWILPLELTLALLLRTTGISSIILPLCALILTLCSVIIFPVLALISLARKETAAR